MTATEWLRLNFTKSISEFDRLVVEKHSGSDWVNITMHVGFDVERVTITLRSEEAVHDLRYMLDCLLEASDAG